MPTFNYFLDSNSFITATAVYTDADLTTKAPNGLYQDCGIYRSQVDGFLTDPIDCPFCNLAECGTKPSNGWVTPEQGYYEFDIDLGTTTGLWIVKFSAANIPNGIIVTYDGVDYTGGSSENFGYLAGPYFGTNSFITDYDFPNQSPYFVNVMEWDGQQSGAGVGNNFIAKGTTETVSIAPADVSGTATSSGFVHLFVPKTAAEPQTATIKCIGPVGGTSDSFTLKNDCPITLVSFEATTVFPNATDACSAPAVFKQQMEWSSYWNKWHTRFI